MSWAAGFGRDLQLALRSLARDRSYTLGSVAALALAFMAVTLVYTFVDGILVRPLDLPQAQRVVSLWQVDPEAEGEPTTVSYGTFTDWRLAARSFATLAAYESRRLVVSDNVDSEQVQGLAVTPAFFDVLGVAPRYGRDFSGQEAEAVLSHDLWLRRFGGDRALVGRVLRIDESGYRLAGVMPSGFSFPVAEGELWLHDPPEVAQLHDRGHQSLEVIGRLQEGVEPSWVAAEMSALVQRLAERYPDDETGRPVEVVSLQDKLTADIRTALWLLLVAVSCVLLLAAVNVANLLLARAIDQQRNHVLRTALGARFHDLLRGVLAETLMVALLGGAAGLLLGGAAARLLRLLVADLPLVERVGLDGRTVMVVLLLTVAVAGVLAALVLLRLPRRVLQQRLAGGRSATAGRADRLLQGALVVSQVALAFALLVAAGLMVRTFAGLRSVDPGFSVDRVVTLSLSLPDSRYPEDADQLGYVQRVLERVRALPEVAAAGGTTTLPLEGSDIALDFVIAGREPPAGEAPPSGGFDVVTTGYFEALGIQVVAGRSFDERDHLGSPPVAMINRTLAQRFFPDRDPVGESLQVLLGGEPNRRIVGVIDDIRHGALDAPPRGEIYLTYAQRPVGGLRLAIRTEGEVAPLVGEVQRAIRAVDPLTPPARITTLAKLRADSVSRERLAAALLGLFAGLGLVLAAVGIYSVTAYLAVQRTPEIGLRMAIGADRADVLWRELRRSIALIGGGIVLGALLSLAFGHLMAALLYGVEPTDPATFAAAAGVLVTASLLAALRPAWRAAHVDPSRVLRWE